MIEPKIDKESLRDRLASSFGVIPLSVNFLPVGFDARSFSYDCHTADHQRFYLKLRRDDGASDLLSTSLKIASLVEGAIHPLTDSQGEANWVQFGSYKMMLFPFVEGVPGWDIELSAEQWRRIGKTVRSLHDVVLTQSMAEVLPREEFSGKWRCLALKDIHREILTSATDGYASAMLKLLGVHRDRLVRVVEHAQDLSLVLLQRQTEFVCCHGDLHSGNFLITPSGSTHPVDWDNVSLAPREKDLMFVGAGIGGMLDAAEGKGLFLAGYGEYSVCTDALRYFRLERIVQDVVAFSDQLLENSDGGPLRAVLLEQFSRQFHPGGVVDVALNP